MTERLAARPSWSGGLVGGHVHGPGRGHMLWSVGRRHMDGWLHGVVRRYRVVGALSRHTVGPRRRPKPRLRQRLLESTVAHVRGVELRAPMARARSPIGTSRRRWRRGLHWEPITWDERLRFRIEHLTVVTARDGVLTLGIIRVGIRGKLTVSIRDSWRRYRARPRRVSVLGEALLRPRWLSEIGHGTAVRAAHGRSIRGSVTLLRRGRPGLRHSLGHGRRWVLQPG
jgi:hypothetical protein